MSRSFQHSYRSFSAGISASPTQAAHDLSVRLRAITLLIYYKQTALSMVNGKLNTLHNSSCSKSKGDLPMSNLNNINLNLELGQEILVGNNNERAKITKIEYHDKTGEININTTRGPRKVLTFRLCEERYSGAYENPADKYR